MFSYRCGCFKSTVSEVVKTAMLHYRQSKRESLNNNKKKRGEKKTVSAYYSSSLLLRFFVGSLRLSTVQETAFRTSAF